MTKHQTGSDEQRKPAPRIDPDAPPVRASELAEDEAANERADEEPSLEHNAEAEIEIERARGNGGEADPASSSLLQSPPD